MASPVIDLTGSDDEPLLSVPSSKTKRRAGEEDMATLSKRAQHLHAGLSGSSSSASVRRGFSSASPNTPSGRGQRSQSNPSHPRDENDRRRQQLFPLSLDDSEDEIDKAFELEEITRIAYAETAHRSIEKQPPTGCVLVDSAYSHSHQCMLKRGANIELQDGDFLRIAYIFWDETRGQDDESAYTLRGLLLRRNSRMGNTFPKRLNEVVVMISLPSDDTRPHFSAGLQDKSLSEFICFRDIRFTNVSFPDFPFRDDPTQKTTGRWEWDRDRAFQEGILVCRYKSVDRWTKQARGKPKAFSQAYLTLDPGEADSPYRWTNSQLMQKHFRETRGRADGAPSNNTAIYGDFVDLFCGGGGASEAARLAGLNVAAAVDFKECAVRTHQHNHPQCITQLMDVFDFIASRTEPGRIICHICHSSCPCQFWSPAHTIPGKNDEANEAAAFMVKPAALKSGCRIMSFEQTQGFSRTMKHRDKWNMFINQFTSMGFSVQWRLISFADTGCANKRPRLWIWATCPGQQMPQDVQPTHGPPGSGLRPYVTVREALANIPADATMHDPESQAEKLRARGSALPTAEWDQPLRELIPTAGPRALHPSGRRPFTVRETLSLQGFPHAYHCIGGENGEPPTRTACMEMAGNAVPPIPAAPYFASAKKALEATDREMAAHEDEDIIQLFE